MSKKTTTVDTGRIEQIPFAQLGISPLNVRKDAEVGPDDELVVSIREHGLLQPLVGYIAKSGPAIVLICAGQRRWLALKHIATTETKIPVRIVDEETAIEVSLAENLERKDMNPADEVLAFKALIETGHYDAARISSRFGFTLQHVRRRLKMAQLLPEILEALHDGQLSLDAATAYASASHEVQREVFKKHSAKGAWKPHEPSQVRQDVSLYGIAVNSRIGKFIGGLEPYLAAGGTTIDEDFGELFTEGQADARMRDLTVVEQLVQAKQKELMPQAEELARKRHHFVAGVEWMNLLGNTWSSTLPKLAKGSPLIAVDGYNTQTITEQAWTAAEEHKGSVYALADIDQNGELTIAEGKFLVDKEAWAKAQPKKEPDEDRRAETPEEREARERERQIEAIMVNFYARSLIGETPGFGTTSVRFDHNDYMQITLTRLTPGGDDVEGENRWDRHIKAELLEPFRDAAAAKLAEIEAEREQAKKAAAVGQEAFEAELTRLEQLPIADWPAAAVLSFSDASHELVITKTEENGEPVLWLVDEMSEGWSSDDPAQTIEIIRDQSEGYQPTLATFDTIQAFAAAHAGRCRMCGCTEDAACQESEDGEWSGPCAWADETQTLCSNPDCLNRVSGVQAVVEQVAEAADA